MIEFVGIAVFKPEDDAPVSGNPDGMEAFQFAAQGVQPVTGDIDVLDLLRRINGCQPVLDSRDLGAGNPFASPSSKSLRKCLLLKLLIIDGFVS